MTVNINRPILRSTALRPLRSLRDQQHRRPARSMALRPLRVKQHRRPARSTALRPLRSLREI